MKADQPYAQQTEPPSDETPAHDSNLLLPGIDIHQVLERLSGNDPLFRMLLRDFYRDFFDVSDRLQTLLNGRRREDYQKAARLVHTIRGMAGNLSAEKLFIAAETLEKAIKAEQRGVWKACLADFNGELTPILQAIATLPVTDQSPCFQHDALANVAHVQSLIVALAERIDSSSPTALQMFELLKTLIPAHALVDPIDALETALRSLQFSSAQVALTALCSSIERELEHHLAKSGQTEGSGFTTDHAFHPQEAGQRWPMENGRARILIVDDAWASVAILAQILCASYTIVIAASGKQALEVLKTQSIDLVLLDIIMPDMDGYTVCRQMKEQAETHDIPVIFITVMDGESDEIMGFAAGAVDYISKPFKPAVVLARVSTHLTMRFMQQELIRKNTTLHTSITAQHKADEEMKRAFQSRQIISALLRTALEPYSLEEQLQQTMDRILEISWIAIQAKGSIFLMDPVRNCLKMAVQRGLSPILLERCAEVALGYCLCGQAAQTKEMVFANHLDENHHVRFNGISDHGHYCIPILSQGTLLGVLNLYIPAGHEKNPEEEAFLSTVADTLAGLIVRKRMEDELLKHRDQLEALVTTRTAELTQAHNAAKERETLLWTIFTSSLDAFIMMDAEGKIVEFSPSAEQLFGYSRADVIGQNLAGLIIPPEWRERHCQKLAEAGRQALANGEIPVSRRVTTDGLRADGKLVDLEITVSTVMSHGKPVFTAFLRDVTSRKQLRLSLHAALSTAETAFRAKDMFLANMSHEIRTPMNGVLGMIDLALGTDSHERVRDFLSHAKSSSHILLRLINDILDYSKIESGKLLMESVDFYLGDVLADAINLFRQTAIDKELELIVSAPPQSIGVLVGDRMRLQQVLVNLVGNAIKFTQVGGIHIKAVLVEETPERVRLEFSVKDTGVGIGEDQVTQLFSPFVQADSTITRKFGGTGLGLTICKRLVAMMGGEIWIVSTLHVGSTFFFTVVLGRNQSSVPYRPVLPDDLLRLKTLVVDDNSDARMVTTEMLIHMGLKTTAVESGQQCLDALLEAVRQGIPYGLVLLDWRMPGMNGIETAQKIRAEPLLNGTSVGHSSSVTALKIIMMTAFGKEEIIQHAKRIGVDACLIKPMTPSLLLDTILDVCGKTATKVYDARLDRIDKTAVIRSVGGAHVLLAEDNMINQRVAREMLENVGVGVTVANNGQEAIHLLLNKPFELVFMDVQMPVMDGYQATRQLRSMESFKSLPIIAMTAHALVGDRENCLAAGMNDYISKPIDMQQLFQVLLKWIKPQGNPVNVSALLARSASREEDQDSLADLPGIHVKAALLAMGTTVAFYKQMWRDFVRDHAEDTERIRSALFVQDDPDAGRLMVHSIKGMSGNLGARHLYAAANNLEQAIGGNQRDAWAHLLEQFERAMEEVLQSVAFLSQDALADTPLPLEESETLNLDHDAVTHSVETMLHWLRKGCVVEALENLGPLQQLLVGTFLQQELSKLERAIDQFALDTACQHLETIHNRVQSLKEDPPS